MQRGCWLQTNGGNGSCSNVHSHTYDVIEIFWVEIDGNKMDSVPEILVKKPQYSKNILKFM
jgi:6-pyruvoyl-tetrahydropterin synthase